MTRGQKIYLAVTAVFAFWGSAAPVEPFSSEAASILDRSVEASGGKAAHARINNRVTRIRMEIMGQGIVIQGTITSGRPNLNYTSMESEVTGKIERGTDGSVVWSNSATTGLQRVEGAEREEFLYQAQLDRLVEWRQFHTAAAVAGEGEVDGRACRKVELTPRGVKPQTLCFDKESGLLVGMQMKLTTPAGEIPATISLNEYRDVDGVKLPFVVKTRLPGQERVTTMEEIRHNQELPASRFAVPAALAAKR